MVTQGEKVTGSSSPMNAIQMNRNMNLFGLEAS